MDALVVVDLQRAFPVPPDLVRRIEARLPDFPRRVFTRFINRPDSLFRHKLGREGCEPGTPETELLVPVSPGDLVLDKPGYGLTAEHIAQLKAANLRRVAVCGIETDACVLAVCFSLFDAGIDCHVEPELCWSSIGLHDVALKVIRAQFAAA